MTRDPSDYSWLPADLRAFIAMTEADYPPDAVTLSMARQRAVYDTSCARFDQPHPPGLRTEDRTIAGDPAPVFARMAEWRMSEVMGERQGLGEVFVEPQRAGNAAGNLGHFQ